MSEDPIFEASKAMARQIKDFETNKGEASVSDQNSVPAVYGAIGKVLAALAVAKNGTLPGNMGGKPYVTAADVSAEVKRLFVENALVYFPVEKTVKHEVIQFKDRLNIAIVIEGSYTIVSVADGSSVSIGGVGDGLASGTAVASNIASTNALKNALMRTFLITEQSVEDAAKNGEPDPEGPNRAQQRIAAGKDGAEKPAPRGDAIVSPIKALQDKIKEAAKIRKESEPDFDYLKHARSILGKDAEGFASDPARLERVLKSIAEGEVA